MQWKVIYSSTSNTHLDPQLRVSCDEWDAAALHLSHIRMAESLMYYSDHPLTTAVSRLWIRYQIYETTNHVRGGGGDAGLSFIMKSRSQSYTLAVVCEHPVRRRPKLCDVCYRFNTLMETVILRFLRTPPKMINDERPRFAAPLSCRCSKLGLLGSS